MRSDARVEPDALDNGPGVKAFHSGVCVEFVEIAHAERKVGVGEKFHGFRLGGAHEQGWNVFFQCSLLQETGESPSRFVELLLV